ncbi:3-oxoadipate enol-lactonase [Marmoricola sp. OAE513]|uniref:alpha/beta hydrolase n=1 Tax=Marmoricola sp. OAE513 TaxID=2817894 RepID=UPI001AE45C41
MTTLRLGADQIWYDDLGGSGVPLVLLHPGITDSRVWDPLLPLLAGRRVIRFDRRGFGRSAAPTEDYSALGDLTGLLDALELERVHLVGNSMGGEASLALAVTAPERVASMTLLCPGVSGYAFKEVAVDPDLEARWDAAKEAQDLSALGRIQGEYWCASGTDEYLDNVLLRSCELDNSPAAAFEQPHPEQWSHLADLTIPTTVIAGDLDPEDSLQASLDLAERIPGAVLVRLPVDHLPQYRDPAGVAEAVLATVARGE